jgi:nucleotide-binding universal stress UspA family protein
MAWRILLCSDGSDESEGSEAALRSLGLLPEAEVVVLGVVEPTHEAERLSRSLQAMSGRLEKSGALAQVRLRRGHAAEEILAEAESQTYDLVVVGARGRSGMTRFRLGSTATRLAAHLPTSMLACRGAMGPVRDILICTGLEEPALSTVRVGGKLAAASVARVTLLHVMSQVALSWESPADDLADSAESAMARNSREGALLQRGLEVLQEVGAGKDAVARLRHGLVVDEVLEEIRELEPQLLIVGAHRLPETRRSIAPLLDDVAQQIMTNAPCSVLIVRESP